MTQWVQLTLTLLPRHLDEAAAGKRINILDQLKKVVPSARYVAGNVNFSVTVALDADHEAALRTSMGSMCTVAPRVLVEPFAVGAKR